MIDNKERIINILKDFTKGNIKPLKEISLLTGEELYSFLDSLSTRNSSYLYLRGNVTESIIKLSVFLKYSEFNNYKLYQGKIRSRKEVERVEEVYGGTSKGGEVDIIMENDEEIFVISSKVKNELTWKETEIREMFYSVELYFQENKELNKKRRYGVIIKDKSSQLLKDSDYIKEIKRKWNLVIYDYNDLYKMWKYIIEVLKEYNFNPEKINQNFGNTHRIKLTLFPHQKYVFEEFRRKIEEENHKSILFHMKPRSGKTFTTLYILNYLRRTKGIKNVLLLTFYPSLNYQWKEVIDRYIEFKDWNLIISNSEKEIVLKENTVNFVMISYQELVKEQNYEFKEKFQRIKILNEKENMVKEIPLKEVNWDVVVWDEVHTASETFNGRIIKENILKYDLFISLSATPEKNLILGSFDEFNTITWTEVDEYLSKKGKHPILLKMGYSEDELKEIYGNVPDFNYYIIDTDEVMRKEIKRYEKEIEDKFLFSMYKLFLYEWLRNDGLTKLIEILFGKNLMDFRMKGLLWKINKRNVEMDKMTFLFFVNPRFTNPDNGEIVDSQEVLKEYLLKNEVVRKVFGEHFIHIVNSRIVDSSKLLDYVNSLEYNKYGSQKYRIIILIDQLRTGITLPNVSTVVMMDDTMSYQKLKQTSYRSQSPYKNKIDSIVVDLNPYRTYDPLNVNQLIRQIFEKKNNLDEKDRELLYKMVNESINIFIYDYEGYTLKKINIQDYNEMYSQMIKNISNPVFTLSLFTKELVKENKKIVEMVKNSEVVKTSLFDELKKEMNKVELNDLQTKKGKTFDMKFNTSKKSKRKILKSSIEKKIFSILFGITRVSVFFDLKNIKEIEDVLLNMKKFYRKEGYI